MIRFEIVTNKHDPSLEVIAEDFNRLASILDECNLVKEYKAFNGTAQFTKEYHSGYYKMVEKFSWE